MSTRTSGISRREFVRDAGGLVIGFSMLDTALAPRLLAQPAAHRASPSPKKLESWLHILPDGGVQVFTGKLEIGMGVDTALTQIVAEELDLAPSRVKFVLGDTVDHRRSGRRRRQHVGQPGRKAASQRGRRRARGARATRVAATRCAVDQLQVRDGVVSVQADATKRVVVRRPRRAIVRRRTS